MQSENSPQQQPASPVDAPAKKTQREKHSDQPKKPVGRPRKNIPAEVLIFSGIVATPETHENIIELTYSNAQSFKKISQLFKAYSVGEIRVVFAPAGMFFSGSDHTGQVKIEVFVDGRTMNSYYCGEATEICSNFLNFNKSFGAIGKNHEKISMHVSSNRKTTLVISLYESLYANITSTDINLTKMGPLLELPTPGTAASVWDWILRFVFVSKHLKSMIANIGQPTNLVRITKQIDAPLCIDSEGGRDPSVRNLYMDDNLLHLEQKLAPPNEIFSVSFGVEKIRPLANASLGKNIIVTAYNGSQISFLTTMDPRGAYNAFTIEVLVNIHNYHETSEAN